jgi:hypothetical protein
VNERRFRPTTSTHIQLRVIFEHCDQQAASGGESSQVQHRTDGVGRAKATRDPGVTERKKRWRLLLKVKNYASNKAKKKKRAALMARSKKRAASSKSDKSNTSFQL